MSLMSLCWFILVFEGKRVFIYGWNVVVIDWTSKIQGGKKHFLFNIFSVFIVKNFAFHFQGCLDMWVLWWGEGWQLGICVWIIRHQVCVCLCIDLYMYVQLCIWFIWYLTVSIRGMWLWQGRGGVYWSF